MNALENRTSVPAAVEVAALSGVSKRFGDFTAVDDVSFTLRANTIYGLLGRNGAGKSTIMRMISGQALPTSGQVMVRGAEPFENDAITQQICFAAENQVYPDGFRVRDVLTAARLLYPRWDQDYADELLEVFNLPKKRHVKKLSRGMRSAVGIVVGLAARAPITIFDEPYLGLDATSRQLFYDRLLADYAENPRTIMLSTHLIDEVSELIEHVLVIDRGRLVIDEEAELLRGRAISVSGPTELVDKFSYAMTRIHEEQMLGQSRVTVLGDPDDPQHARALGLDVKPVSLQQLVVQSTLQVNPEKTEGKR
ncbi:ABC transporter ATP-binding protein [Kineosporia rhizophila]|uniref:ABC transporter ATP-binding protein n=1 Tax=Kineosporia TaxID=49184 RepID=UPI000AA3F73D|nr:MULTISPECIES: ABC transporter ATP-binding protein [Kineosporia]MCE0534644.1 ABC transporter ATP-binding protein [Kineosporia rhizophila]GLY15565.1 ABC transporter ATP-binding protein [Kineosporia sp. NBRC 101677]